MATAPTFESQLTGANRDAYMALTTLFKTYNLQSLAPKIFDYIKNGYSADTIAILLQDTSEYKQRFAGNTARLAKGLPVLSAAQYLSVESSYRQIMKDAGLPVGFYDSPADFTQWIGTDVSPTEVKGRVDLAVASTSQANPWVKQQLAALYGVDDAHLTSYFLDQNRSLPILQKQQQAAAFGAEAARRGLLSDATRMEDYVTSGLSQSQASQGFQTVAEELPNLMALADRFGVTFGQQDEEQAVFGTSAVGTAKRKGLASQERALFSSGSGAGAGGLNAGYRQTT